MFEIPSTVEIDGEQLNIRNKGDFRMVLDCFAALNDIDLDEKERVYCALIIFYERFNKMNRFLFSSYLEFNFRAI